MKKFFVMMLISAVMFITQSTFAAENIKVIIDNEIVEFDVQPQIVNNRTMVPMRTIFEKLGATIEWNQQTNTVTAVKDSTKISLTVGEEKIIINDEEKVIDASPCVIDGRTLAPVRVISEAFDLEVNWDERTKTITISSFIENTPSKTAIAYDKLKNAVIEFGAYNERKDYTILDSPDGADYGYLITYDPNRELSILYVSEDENMETGIMINFFEQSPPELTMKIVKPGKYEYKIYGVFGEDKKFIEEKVNVRPELRKPARDLMKSTVGLMDLLLQKNADGLTLNELGISY